MLSSPSKLTHVLEQDIRHRYTFHYTVYAMQTSPQLAYLKLWITNMYSNKYTHTLTAQSLYKKPTSLK